MTAQNVILTLEAFEHVVRDVKAAFRTVIETISNTSSCSSCPYVGNTFGRPFHDRQRNWHVYHTLFLVQIKKVVQILPIFKQDNVAI